jgi:hypothetical protein
MTDLSRQDPQDSGDGALFIFLALGGFWVMVAAIGWMSL